MNSENGMTKTIPVCENTTNMVTTVNNTTNLVCPNASQKDATGTKGQSVPEEYICKYIDSGDSIKNPPVLWKLTENEFSSSKVSIEDKEKRNLDGKETSTAYAEDHVPLLDDFLLDVNDQKVY